MHAQFQMDAVNLFQQVFAQAWASGMGWPILGWDPPGIPFNGKDRDNWETPAATATSLGWHWGVHDLEPSRCPVEQ